MHLAFPLELVHAKVASGTYTSSSEVVREAMRPMDEQDRMRTVKLDPLREALRQGLASGTHQPRGATEVEAQARARRLRQAASSPDVPTV